MTAPDTPTTIAIADITPSGLRPVDPLRAQAYAASIEQRGLSQPISLRPDSAAPGKYIVIDGDHRLQAFKILGWTELESGKHIVVQEVGEDEAQGRGLDANLFSGMSALDRAIFLFEAKKRHDKKRGETRGRKRKDVEFKEKEKMADSAIIFSERFSKDAAKRVGLAEVVIKEACRIASRLNPDAIAAIRGTMVEDNQNELRQLADLDGLDQIAVAKAIQTGEAKNVLQGKVAAGLQEPEAENPQVRIAAKLTEAWTKADSTTRRAFMAEWGLAWAKNPASGRSGPERAEK
jgi:ParB family chromosome partitioning protein